MDASTTSMIILLRETIQCGNADCNLDRQVSLSSPSFATLIFQFPGTPYALRILKKLLTICHSTIHVMYKGSYRYMHFLATLSKIKWYSELVIHTIHAAFFPRLNGLLCLSLANTHPWTSALLCYFLYFLAVAIALYLYCTTWCPSTCRISSDI